MDSEASTVMTCVLKVDTMTPGWQKSLGLVLKRVKDVTFSIDAQHGLAYVSGNVEPAAILKVLAKAGKHADLYRVDYGHKGMHQPNQTLNQITTLNYFDHPTEFWQYDPYHHYYYDYPPHPPPPMAPPPPPPSATHFPPPPPMLPALDDAHELQCSIM